MWESKNRAAALPDAKGLLDFKVQQKIMVDSSLSHIRQLVYSPQAEMQRGQGLGLSVVERERHEPATIKLR